MNFTALTSHEFPHHLTFNLVPTCALQPTCESRTHSIASSPSRLWRDERRPSWAVGQLRLGQREASQPPAAPFSCVSCTSASDLGCVGVHDTRARAPALRAPQFSATHRHPCSYYAAWRADDCPLFAPLVRSSASTLCASTSDLFRSLNATLVTIAACARHDSEALGDVW